jgi:hypothetical protein
MGDEITEINVYGKSGKTGTTLERPIAGGFGDSSTFFSRLRRPRPQRILARLARRNFSQAEWEC